MEKLIFHIDVNSAFLSWMAVERLKNGFKNDIRNENSVIGGDEDLRRGIVLAKSDKAKKRGIITGESLYSARTKCENLKNYRGDFTVFSKYSNLMNEIFKEYTSSIEKYSIDESFLDFSKECFIEKNYMVLAKEIKERIFNELGFTVNIGISTNKLLAKMASEFEKPNKIHTLFEDEIKEKMWGLPIEDLFFVGKNTAKKLREININTIGDLANISDKNIELRLKKQGLLLKSFANGIDKSSVIMKNKVKSIGNSITLANNLINIEDIFEVLYSISKIIAERLKKSNLECFTMMLRYRNSKFKDISIQKTYNKSINNNILIYEKSKELFVNLWKNESIRMIGIRLTNLKDKVQEQISFF